MNSSSATIGGADGPTAIVISGSITPLVIGLIVVAVAIAAIIILIKRKKKK